MRRRRHAAAARRRVARAARRARAVAIMIAWCSSPARRALLPLVLAACSLDAGSWDDAVDNGPTGDAHAYLDVYSAEPVTAMARSSCSTSQPLATGALRSRPRSSRSCASAPSCRCSASPARAAISSPTTATEGASLLGWARADAGDGTAELVELAAPRRLHVRLRDRAGGDRQRSSRRATASRHGRSRVAARHRRAAPPIETDEPEPDRDRRARPRRAHVTKQSRAPAALCEPRQGRDAALPRSAAPARS